VVVLALLLLKGPGVVLEENLDCLLESMVGEHPASDLLPGDGLDGSLKLVVLLEDLAFVAESVFGDHGVFHEHEGDLADEVVGYLGCVLDRLDLAVQPLHDLPSQLSTLLCMP
jgi:hypothetical protein